MVLFGLSWFLIFYFHFLNPDPEQEKAFLKIASTLPMIGILLILLEYSRAFGISENNSSSFSGVLFFCFCISFICNIGYYQDGASYWKRAVETSPHSSFAWNNLGAMEYLRGEKKLRNPTGNDRYTKMKMRNSQMPILVCLLWNQKNMKQQNNISCENLKWILFRKRRT